MSPDVASTEGDDGRNALFQGLLSPTLNEKLAELALRSEEAGDIAEGLERSGRFLDRCAAQQSDLGATARLLRTKVVQLRELNSQLSRQVMRHSHRLEDAATLAATCVDRDRVNHDTDDEAGVWRRRRGQPAVVAQDRGSSPRPACGATRQQSPFCPDVRCAVCVNLLGGRFMFRRHV